MAFFAIMNPVANAPIFLTLTASDDAATKKKIAFKSLALAFVIIAVCSLAGKLIFGLFGITLPALRITGGVLVFLIGLQMLHGSQSKVHSPSGEDIEKSIDAQLSVAVSPLAVPILAGPGTIATAMNFSAHAGILQTVITIGAFALLCVVTYGFFIWGEKFTNYIGESAVKVITRIMGLILAAIGMQMLLQGVYGAVAMYR